MRSILTCRAGEYRVGILSTEYQVLGAQEKRPFLRYRCSVLLTLLSIRLVLLAYLRPRARQRYNLHHSFVDANRVAPVPVATAKANRPTCPTAPRSAGPTRRVSSS